MKETALHRNLRSLFFGYILFAIGCSGSAAPSWRAQTPDSRIEFSLSESTARSAFDEFCEAQVESPCDDFGNYRIEIVVDDLVIMNFIHEDIGSRGALVPYPVIMCYYTNNEFRCFLEGG